MRIQNPVERRPDGPRGLSGPSALYQNWGRRVQVLNCIIRNEILNLAPFGGLNV
jgi:hypothetical protein